MRGSAFKCTISNSSLLRIVQFHLDRSPGDAIGYDEYQRLTQANYEAGHLDITYGLWLSKLDAERMPQMHRLTVPQGLKRWANSSSSLLVQRKFLSYKCEDPYFIIPGSLFLRHTASAVLRV